MTLPCTPRKAILLLVCIASLVWRPGLAQRSTPEPAPARMAGEVVEFLEWAMQTSLDASARRSVADSLRAGWERGTSGDIAGMRAIHAARDSVSRMSPRDRSVVRPALERQFLRGFRQQPAHPAARAFLPALASRPRPVPAVHWPGDAPAAAPVACLDRVR
jgi:hypothetical protein